jgi:hypothetical protein
MEIVRSQTSHSRQGSEMSVPQGGE